MVYVELPEIGLVGEWSVSDAERTVAARLLPMLPGAPGPGADTPTRRQIVDATLRTGRSPGRAALIDIARTFLADGWRVDHANEIFHELV